MSRQTKIGTIVVAIALLGIGMIAVPTMQMVQAHKLTATSYSDGYQNGQQDARRDYAGLNGHGYDSSCPSDHTDVYCSGYERGYSNTWANLGGNGYSNMNQDQNTDQAQSSSVNVKGNNNHVNVHQGQASSNKQSSIAYGLGRGVKHFFDGIGDQECDSNGYCN